MTEVPGRYARVAGFLYLYIIAAGIFAEFVRSRLLVSDDAATTAANVAANEMLFRVGFSAEFLHLASDVVVSVILYTLFRSVNRVIAAIALFMRAACIIILAASGVVQFAVLRLITDAGSFVELPVRERHALALLAMRLHGDGYAISLLFFGFSCVALGYLIYRSSYLPHAIGIALQVAGVCYLVSSFVTFLYPQYAPRLLPLFVPIFIAELSLASWLAFRGVDGAAWRRGAVVQES